MSLEYPNKVQFSPNNQLNDNSQYSNDDKESVSIENPEFRRKSFKRKGENQGINDAKNVKNIPKIQENQPSESGNNPSLARMDNLSPNLAALKEAGNRAFYYHFTHTIPMPVERVDDSEENKRLLQTSVSTRAQELGRIPIAAVHDAQVSPLQTGTISNFQLYPVYQPEHK